MKNQKMESRRKFLLKGFSDKNRLIADIASLVRGDEEQNEKIKLLTADGKLVEVDRKVIKKSQPAVKTSNAEILEWMEKGRKNNGSKTEK